MFRFFNRKTVKSINVNELDNNLGEINLIDVREPYEYKMGHLPKAKNIPLNKIISEAENHLDKSKEYYIICRSGSRSLRACNKLNKEGYKVVNISGGIARYRGDLKK